MALKIRKTRRGTALGLLATWQQNVCRSAECALMDTNIAVNLPPVKRFFALANTGIIKWSVSQTSLHAAPVTVPLYAP
jgi:hypothetical protein